MTSSARVRLVVVVSIVVVVVAIATVVVGVRTTRSTMVVVGMATTLRSSRSWVADVMSFVNVVPDCRSVLATLLTEVPSVVLIDARIKPRFWFCNEVGRWCLVEEI